MLYDNAQLARVYLHAWQVTGNEFFRTTTEEILDYVIREMTDPAGGFHSTQDADSEGKEGKFFVWTTDQIRDVLGDQADQFIDANRVTTQRNFEGKNILELRGTLEQRQALSKARARLLSAGEARVHPGRDEKVLTSWNSLMLAAFAEAAAAFPLAGNSPERADRYRRIAEENAEFLLYHLQTDNGRPFHTWKAIGENGDQGRGGKAKYAQVARENLAAVEDYLARAPLGFGQWLVALDYALSRPFEIAIVGPPDDERTRALLGAATAVIFRPHQVVAHGPGGQESPAVPLLEDRDLVEGQGEHARPAAYVCRHFACQAPVTTPEALEGLLGMLCEDAVIVLPRHLHRFTSPVDPGLTITRASCYTSLRISLA